MNFITKLKLYNLKMELKFLLINYIIWAVDYVQRQ